jgi:hypothetical protein
MVDVVNAIVAACAAVIALAALRVSVGQTRLTREHNRKSVMPVLQFGSRFREGETAGLILRNVGLGPAEIVSSGVYLDGELIGEYSRETISRVRDTLEQRPLATTFRSGAFLATDYNEFLLSMPEYDRQKNNGELARLVNDRSSAPSGTYRSNLNCACPPCSVTHHRRSTPRGVRAPRPDTWSTGRPLSLPASHTARPTRRPRPFRALTCSRHEHALAAGREQAYHRRGHALP